MKTNGALRGSTTLEKVVMKMEKEQIATMLIEAHERGHNAALKANPLMVQAVNNQTGEVYEPFAICGFASVIVKGLRGKMLTDFKSRGFEKHYRGGLSLWIRDYNQSYDMKTAYATEYARTLTERGITSWCDSRLD